MMIPPNMSINFITKLTIGLKNSSIKEIGFNRRPIKPNMILKKPTVNMIYPNTVNPTLFILLIQINQIQIVNKNDRSWMRHVHFTNE